MDYDLYDYDSITNETLISDESLEDDLGIPHHVDDENIGQIFCSVILVAMPITLVLIWLYLNKAAHVYQHEVLARKLRFESYRKIIFITAS